MSRMKDEEKQLRTDEDFDELFKLHYYGLEMEGHKRNDQIRISIFEHKGECDETKAIVHLHGGTSPVEEDVYRDEAKEIKKDDEYDEETQKALYDALRERGKRFDKYDTSFRESRKYENATDSWHRLVKELGPKCPKYCVAVSWGPFYILAPDLQGKKYKSATTNIHNGLVREALEKVGALGIEEKWLLSHSMGGMSAFSLLHTEAKSVLLGVDREYAKCFIGDGLVFPGDMKASPFVELLLTLDPARVASRIISELMLYETEWREINPMGRNAGLMKLWPPVLLHSNTEGMWPFSAKHEEIKRVSMVVGAHQVHHHKSPTTHSYLAAEVVKDFLVGEQFFVAGHDPQFVLERHRYENLIVGVKVLGTKLEALDQLVLSVGAKLETLSKVVPANEEKKDVKTT